MTALQRLSAPRPPSNQSQAKRRQRLAVGGSARARVAPLAAALGALLLLAASPAAPPAAAASEGKEAAPRLSPSQLLKRFSAMPGLEASFEEEKHLALLAEPLVSRGKLYFAHPGLLRRNVISPAKSAVLITPSAVVVRDADGKKTIPLARLKAVGALVQSLVWLLAGDEAALRGAFAIDFQQAKGSPGWTMTLRPRRAPLSKLVRQLRITGTGYRVERVRVDESSGDHSVTRILSANPERRFSPAEKRKLFSPDSL